MCQIMVAGARYASPKRASGSLRRARRVTTRRHARARRSPPDRTRKQAAYALSYPPPHHNDQAIKRRPSQKAHPPDDRFHDVTGSKQTSPMATFRVLAKGRPRRQRGARFRGGLPAAAEVADAAPATAFRPEGACCARGRRCRGPRAAAWRRRAMWPVRRGWSRRPAGAPTAAAARPLGVVAGFGSQRKEQHPGFSGGTAAKLARERRGGRTARVRRASPGVASCWAHVGAVVQMSGLRYGPTTMARGRCRGFG